MTTDTTTTTDRFLTVAELISRWPIGRNSTYALIKSPDFPPALVLLRQQNGQPRSMGYRGADILAYEEAHMATPASSSSRGTPSPSCRRPSAPSPGGATDARQTLHWHHTASTPAGR